MAPGLELCPVTSSGPPPNPRVLDGATPTAVAMGDSDASPQDEGEGDDEEERARIPKAVELVKTVLEIVWLVARLLRM